MLDSVPPKQGPQGGIWQCAMCETKTLFYNKDILEQWIGGTAASRRNNNLFVQPGRA